MDILLAGSFDAAEEEEWRQLLGAALPGHRLLLAPDDTQRAAIEAAIVANPPPGSLQGLPRLKSVRGQQLRNFTLQRVGSAGKSLKQPDGAQSVHAGDCCYFAWGCFRYFWSAGSARRLRDRQMARQRSSRAIRLQVSQRLPPIFSTSA